MSRARIGKLAAILASLLHVEAARAQEACFKRIDNGVDMTGWHRSTTNHHGPGLGWTVENGAFVGRQTAGNQGGLLMTDAMYKDVEVVFEVKVDWGCDSGFFFRTTAGDRAYQVLIDHLPQGAVGPFYGEGFAQELYYRPYYLTDMGATAVKDPALTPIFDLATWPTLWKPTAFNEIRARVEGNPPHMQTWISGVKVADYTDPMTRAEINPAGPLAIQVHGGSDRWTATGSVQFRNIRVKDLAVPCVEPPDGGMGDAGADRRDATASGNTPETGGATDVVSGDSGAAAGTGGGAGATASAGTGGGVAGGGAGAGSTGAGGQAGAAPAGDGSGCGCATAASSEVGDFAWFALAMALIAAVHRPLGWRTAGPRRRG